MDRTLESDSESGIDLSEGAIAGDIAAIGEELLAALSPLVAGVGSRGAGPVALARELGVDKVLTSRNEASGN